MGAANYTVWIHARPEDVWRIYVDPSRIPDWQTGSPVIEDISGAGDEPSTTYVSRRGPGAARTTVLEAVRPRHLVTRTEAYLGLQLDLISELTSEGEGTMLELRARTEWPRGRALLGKLIEMVILNPLEARRELARLKTLVEREMKGA
jgi:uncharacterized protein YndB with AHSA1/START domain